MSARRGRGDAIATPGLVPTMASERYSDLRIFSLIDVITSLISTITAVGPASISGISVGLEVGEAKGKGVAAAGKAMDTQQHRASTGTRDGSAVLIIAHPSNTWHFRWSCSELRRDAF